MRHRDIYFKDLSVFVDTKNYQNFLLKQLNYFKAAFIKANLWLRRKILETNSASTNLFSLVNNYIQKNRQYIGENKPFNLYQIINGNL